MSSATLRIPSAGTPSGTRCATNAAPPTSSRGTDHIGRAAEQLGGPEPLELPLCVAQPGDNAGDALR